MQIVSSMQDHRIDERNRGKRHREKRTPLLRGVSRVKTKKLEAGRAREDRVTRRGILRSPLRDAHRAI